MNAAVLTVSDSVHASRREDVSGPTVQGILEKAGWSVVSGVVPDDIEEIASKLQSWARSGEIDAIFTTGGTGVASRDVTPEATRRVIEREIPGLSEWMRSEGMKKTPSRDSVARYRRNVWKLCNPEFARFTQRRARINRECLKCNTAYC